MQGLILTTPDFITVAGTNLLRLDGSEKTFDGRMESDYICLFAQRLSRHEQRAYSLLFCYALCYQTKTEYVHSRV